MIAPFTLFDKQFTAYGFCAAAGVLLCFLYITRVCKRTYGKDGDILLVLAVAGGSAILGSHLLYGIVSVIENHGFPKITSVSGFFRFMNDFFGGSVFYGGLILGAVGAFITLRAIKLPEFPAVDLITPAVPLFHCFGRIGCFLTGCCYGIPSRFGFTFTDSIVTSANGVRRFPVQLLEAAFNLGLFFVLFALLQKGKLKDRLFPLYLCCYGTARFFFEFLRGDTYRGVWSYGLSTSQVISVAVVIVGVILMIAKSRSQSKSGRVTLKSTKSV